MMDLFSFASQHYPHVPGYKRTETSAAAAESVKPRTELLRNRILSLLTPALQLTADEAADLLGESVLSVRPRFSELRELGKITDTGVRRPNESGRSAIVWRLP